MDFDFLNRKFINTSAEAVHHLRQSIEAAEPPEEELIALCERLTRFDHCYTLQEDFIIAASDGSGEFPILNQDDIFMHFVVAAGAVFETCTQKQHKLSVIDADDLMYAGLINLFDADNGVRNGYRFLLRQLIGLDLKDLKEHSDYCTLFSSQGRVKITPADVTWENAAFSKTSQIGTHAYMIRSLAELGTGLRCLPSKPKYLLLDTSLVYFLMGESIYLPELLKRYLINRANEQGTAVLGICKSHNIPNGDLLGRWAAERYDAKNHWFLRLPSDALGERKPSFLDDREVPPKHGVSYLFKFHEVSFPMRLDMDAGFWRNHIKGDKEAEKRLFCDLDYTCHDVRSYGYPYPLHAAHRRASLTRNERKAVRDILLQQSQKEGVLRGAFMRSQEDVHQSGI